MINRTFRSYRFVAPMLALGVAACSGAPGDASISAPAGPRSVRTTAVAGDAGNRIANQGELEICKNGAAGSFEVTPQGGSAFTVNLAAGECRVVATALNLAGPDTARYSVIELPSATSTFTSVTKTTVHFEFAGGSNTTPDEFDAPFVSTTNVAVPVKVNEYIGSLLEYVNTPITTRGCTYTQGWYQNHTSQWPAGFSPTASFDGLGHLDQPVRHAAEGWQRLHPARAPVHAADEQPSGAMPVPRRMLGSARQGSRVLRGGWSGHR